MIVRAKFFVESKIERKEGFCIELFPVINGSKENENFYKYTPGGHLKLMTINAEAAKEFIVGKEYYVDFTKCE
ncbi:MAG: hypothetical protein ACM3O3_12380 [Syntrophothermus sp.]